MRRVNKRALFLQAVPGMKLDTLIKVLRRNHCRVDLRYLHRLAYLIFLASYNSLVAPFEQRHNGARIAATVISEPPIFILGHWRSGTTHLHNLLSQDPRLASPTVFMSMFPHHFAYSRRVLAPLVDLLRPEKRPMDNVPLFSSAPQEDEFAVAALSSVSPYMRFLFPATGDPTYSVLDPLCLPSAALAEWKLAMRLFLRKVTFSKGKRVVLKSPPHLGRVRVLLELFPEAKFIHIVRDPYQVYASTRKLWRDGLWFSHLQDPDPRQIEETILNWYEELFRLFERDRGLIPEGALHELKFEDLEQQPQRSLQRLYESLGLPGFEEFWGCAGKYLEMHRNYRKNLHRMSPADTRQVSLRWGQVFTRYGYPMLSEGRS